MRESYRAASRVLTQVVTCMVNPLYRVRRVDDPGAPLRSALAQFRCQAKRLRVKAQPTVAAATGRSVAQSPLSIFGKRNRLHAMVGYTVSSAFVSP